MSAFLTRRTMIKHSLAAGAATIIGPACHAQEAVALQPPSVDGHVQQFMKTFHVPGMAIAFARGDKTLYTGCFGQADKSPQEIVRPNSLFRIASNSKAFTAAAIFLLIQQGRMSVNTIVFAPDGPLGQYSGLGAHRDWIHAITVHDLLTHTAGGWGNESNDPMFEEDNLNQEQLIAWTLKTHPLSNPPGTKYAYSNFGYCVLGRVIEHVSQQPYAQFVRQHVMTPAGIHDMRIATHKPAPDEVHYYGQGSEDAYNIPITRMDAHGGWISTATDMVTFLAALFSPEDHEGAPPILSAAALQEMTQGTKANPGYACGLAVNAAGNAWHQGSLPGTTSLMVHTRSGVAWAAVANTRSPKAGYGCPDRCADVGDCTKCSKLARLTGTRMPIKFLLREEENLLPWLTAWRSLQTVSARANKSLVNREASMVRCPIAALPFLLFLTACASAVLAQSSPAQTGQSRPSSIIRVPPGVNSGELKLAPDSLLAKLAAGNPARAGSRLIFFVNPGPAAVTHGEQITPKIRLAGLDPSTFKITVNGNDASSRFSSAAACDPSSCEKEGTLGSADGVHTGWNLLQATAHNSGGNVGVATLRFYVPGETQLRVRTSTHPLVRAAVGDPSVSLQQHLVHFSVTNTGDIQIGDSETPGAYNVQNKCGTNQLLLIALDHTTLQQDAGDCVNTDDGGADLARHLNGLVNDTSDIIVVAMKSSSSSAAGLDFTLMGGTNFSLQNSPTPYGYNAVGYIGSKTSSYESYSREATDPYQAIDGVLENACCVAGTPTNPWFVFRPADAPGFSIYFDQNGFAHGTIAYDSNLPLGVPVDTNGVPTSSSLNYEIPSSGGFRPVSFDVLPSSLPVLSIDVYAREDLTSRSSQRFTFTGDVSQDTGTMQAIFQTLANLFRRHDNLYFITYSGGAQLLLADNPFATSHSYAVDYLAAMGSPVQDLASAMSQGTTFAMVGTDDGVTPSGEWWSTPINHQQMESGNLSGVLTRNPHMLYTPTSVMPMPTFLVASPPAPDLSRSDSFMIGAARPVPWPLSSTASQQAAYAWLSSILINYDFYGTPPAPANRDVCPLTAVL